MSNFQKITTGVSRQAQIQGTDIGSGAATSSQFLAANGSGGSIFRILASGDIPSLSSIYLPLTGGTMSGTINMGSNPITNVADPTTAQMVATKSYVDVSLAGLQPQDAVYAATTGSNIPGTYLNGVLGVGATFVTTATGVFTVDGTTPPLGSRILIKDQSSGFQNGVYYISTLGSLGVPTTFTRTLDYNTASDMNSAGLIPVINGTLNALSSWQQVATITTVGTDSLVFTEFTANPSLYLLKANNLSDVASKSTSFNNLSPMTTTGDTIYSSSGTTAARLPIGTTGQVLTVSGGIPTWTTSTSSLTGLGIKAGRESIGSGQTSISVTFAGAYAYASGTAYAVTATMVNTTDTSPQIQPVIVTATTTTGFTCTFNVATQTANYLLSWQTVLLN